MFSLSYATLLKLLWEYSGSRNIKPTFKKFKKQVYDKPPGLLDTGRKLNVHKTSRRRPGRPSSK